jgi:hypothetical protein
MSLVDSDRHTHPGDVRRPSRIVTPSSTSALVVLEVADQLTLLGINADDRLLFGLEVFAHLLDVQELRVSVRMVWPMKCLGIGAGADVHLMEQAAKRLDAERNTCFDQRFCHRAQAATRPAAAAFGVTCGQGLDGGGDVIFPTFG